MKHSTGNMMVLNSVNFANSGAYSCEVIADTTFHTLIQTKHMLVIGNKLNILFPWRMRSKIWLHVRVAK